MGINLFFHEASSPVKKSLLAIFHYNYVNGDEHFGVFAIVMSFGFHVLNYLVTNVNEIMQKFNRLYLRRE